MLEPYEGWAVELPDVESGRVVAAEHPARRTDHLPWLLAVYEQTREQLQKDLRLGVRAHGAEDGVESIVLVE